MPFPGTDPKRALVFIRQGGGVYVYSGTARFASCQIYSNTASTGPNMYVRSEGGSSVCTFGMSLTGVSGSVS